MSELDLPQGITAVTENGLAAFRIDTPAATGLVYAHGAHVAAWAPAGADEVLWLSSRSEYADDKPIRGGIPLCFPWFGPGRDGKHTPGHGYARLVEWTLAEADVTTDGTARLTLQVTGEQLPAEAEVSADTTVRLTVSMGRELNLHLTVVAGAEPFDFEEALHTYFSVADVRRVRIDGLEGAQYVDKVHGDTRTQDGEVTFTEETDRVYLSQATTTIDDGHRRIQVAKAASRDTVVWNPWVAKAAAMADFGDDEWPSMVCVETANALDHAVSLAPGETHTMTATISLA